MRSTPWRLTAFVLLAALAACGTGSSLFPTGGFLASSPTFALPYLPTLSGESAFLVLANYTEEDADVTVQAFAPNGGFAPLGAPYAPPVTVMVPGKGTSRLPVASFTGLGSGPGYLHVDTRDVATLDPVTGEPVPVATTGFVIPSLEREISGVVLRGDAMQGLVPRPDAVHAALHSLTTGAQVINRSITPMAGGSMPAPLLVTIAHYAADGTMASSSDVLLPPLGTFEFAPLVALGHVHVMPKAPVPAGVEPGLALATREEGGVVHAAPRFQDTEDLLDAVHDVGFFADWGADNAGNVYDFSVVLSNPTSSALTATLRAVQREGTVAILTAPRVINMAPHRTLVLGTTNLVSEGLVVGEMTPLGDLFGDALAATRYERALLWISVPRDLEVSARTFDPAFGSFYTVERGARRTTNAFASSQPVEPVLGTGRFNDLLLANPGSQAMTIPVRVHTPGGTEYLLDSVQLGPFQRMTWSLDGRAFREDPNSLVEPPVERVKVKFSPTSGLFVGARTRRVNASDLLLLVTPRIVDAAD
jgi:hypothetical protein